MESPPKGIRTFRSVEDTCLRFDEEVSGMPGPDFQARDVVVAICDDVGLMEELRSGGCGGFRGVATEVTSSGDDCATSAMELNDGTFGGRSG